MPVWYRLALVPMTPNPYSFYSFPFSFHLPRTHHTLTGIPDFYFALGGKISILLEAIQFMPSCIMFAMLCPMGRLFKLN